MKKFIAYSLGCLLSGFLSMACQRNQGVRAANESEYKPRPAPIETFADPDVGIKGELLRVNVIGKTIVIRVANGMEQTFKFDSDTSVTGIEHEKEGISPVRSLIGKEGSEVNVRWRDRAGVKIATSVEVTQISTSNNTRRVGRRPY